MDTKKRKKEPEFIKYANSPPEEDIITRFTNALLKTKGLSSISETHERLIRLLSSIIKNKKIEEGEDLDFFLNAYDTPRTSYIFENGNVVESKAGRLVCQSILTINSLVEFLAGKNDLDLKNLKRCAQCKAFFLQARKDERNRFCVDECRNLYYQEQRKTDAGRKARAKYMLKHRKFLKSLRDKRAERKKAAERKQQADREHAVEEAWDTLKESLKPER